MSDKKEQYFGHYQVVCELGRGGMAVVYKCYEENLNRFVAIKVLSDHLAHDKETKERFMREAKTMASVNHINVIQVHFIGEEQGQPFFAMQYIKGQSLSELLKPRFALDVNQAKNLIYQASKGLLVAHEKGLIHRDIKPGNLMIAEDGCLKIVDFGIAQSKEFDTNLTNTGEIVGTPGYLSPEVCIGQKVDNRADIFSLGIVFYQMLAGKVPFDNDSPLGLLLEVVESNSEDIRKINKNVDKKTAKILKQMIARDPKERFQSADEIITALDHVNKISSIEEIKQARIEINHVSIQKETDENITLPSNPVNKKQKEKISHSYYKIVYSGLLLVAIITLSILYNYSTKLDTNEIIQNDFVGNNMEVEIPQMENDKVKDIEPLIENNETGDSIPQDSPVSQVNKPCIEVFPIKVSTKKVGLFNRAIKVPKKLLKSMRQLFSNEIAQSNKSLDVYQTWEKRCENSNQSFKFIVEVTNYKPKGVVSKDRIVLELNLYKKESGKRIAQKRVIDSNVSRKITSKDKEFINKITKFINSAI